jgi:hypothetical protein
MDKKAKVRRDESNVLSDDSREGLSPIRDLVDKKGPMGGKKGKNATGNADLNVTNVDTTTPANIMERYFGEEIDLGNAQFDQKAEDIRMARKIMKDKVKDVQADDRSSFSKGRRGTKVRKSTAPPGGIFGTSNMSGGKGSMDESMLNQSL